MCATYVVEAQTPQSYKSTTFFLCQRTHINIYQRLLLGPLLNFEIFHKWNHSNAHIFDNPAKTNVQIIIERQWTFLDALKDGNSINRNEAIKTIRITNNNKKNVKEYGQWVSPNFSVDFSWKWQGEFATNAQCRNKSESEGWCERGDIYIKRAE